MGGSEKRETLKLLVETLKKLDQRIYTKQEILRAFKDQCGMDLNYQKFGHTSLEGFLFPDDHFLRNKDKIVFVPDPPKNSRETSQNRNNGKNHSKRDNSAPLPTVVTGFGYRSGSPRGQFRIPDKFLRVLLRKLNEKPGMTMEDFLEYFAETSERPLHPGDLSVEEYLMSLPQLVRIVYKERRLYLYPKANTLEEARHIKISPELTINTRNSEYLDFDTLCKLLHQVNRIFAGKTKTLDEYYSRLRDVRGDEAVSFVKNICESRREQMIFIKENARFPYSVDIDGDTFIISKPIPAFKGELQSFSKSSAVPFTDAFSTTPLPSPGIEFAVCVCDVFDEWNKLSVIRWEKQDARDKLMEKLCDFYEVNAHEFVVEDGELYEGMPCICCYSGKNDFHRAVVYSLSEDRITMYFCDYGTLMDKSKNDMFYHITQEFLETEAFASLVQVARVRSVKNDVDSLNELRSLIRNDIFDNIEPVAVRVEGSWKRKNLYKVFMPQIYQSLVEKGLVKFKPKTDTSGSSEPTTASDDGNAEEFQFRDSYQLHNGACLILVRKFGQSYIPSGCLAQILGKEEDSIFEDLRSQGMSVLNVISVDKSTLYCLDQLRRAKCPFIDNCEHILFVKASSVLPVLHCLSRTNDIIHQNATFNQISELLSAS